jgi:hypothetical protein
MSIRKQIVRQFIMHWLCHSEFISESRIFLRQILKQACPEEIPKQVRDDTSRVQDDTYQIAF